MTSPAMKGAIAAALKTPFSLIIRYQEKQDAEPRDRTVKPHRLLFDTRPYLIARDLTNGPGFRRFRLDRISQAKIAGQSFVRHMDFDLNACASQSIRSFHSEAKFGPVTWRVSQAAAANARAFLFHPDQNCKAGLALTMWAVAWPTLLYFFGLYAAFRPSAGWGVGVACSAV